MIWAIEIAAGVTLLPKLKIRLAQNPHIIDSRKFNALTRISVNY